MKPVCVPCQRFFRPAKNGYRFIEGMPRENGAEPGKEHADQWQPYKLWNGDLYRCAGCGAEIIVGVAHQPVAEHYQPEFADTVANFRATLQVNDC